MTRDSFTIKTLDTLRAEQDAQAVTDAARLSRTPAKARDWSYALAEARLALAQNREALGVR